MKIEEFLKNIDFEKEYVKIYLSDDRVISTSFFADNEKPCAIISDEIDGFITITEGETMNSFRPSLVTGFTKFKKLTSLEL